MGACGYSGFVPAGGEFQFYDRVYKVVALVALVSPIPTPCPGKTAYSYSHCPSCAFADNPCLCAQARDLIGGCCGSCRRDGTSVCIFELGVAVRGTGDIVDPEES